MIIVDNGHSYTTMSSEHTIYPEEKNKIEAIPIENKFSSQQYQYALESCCMGAWTYYPANKQFELDAFSAQLCGLDNANCTLSWEKFIQLIHEADVEIFIQQLFHIAENNAQPYLDVVYRRRLAESTNEVYIRNRAKVFYGPNGNPEFIAGTLTDVTESRKQKQKEKDLEVRYQSAFDNASPGIIMSDMEGRFLFINKSFCSMMGYKQDELLGKCFIDVTHPDDIELSRNFTQALLNSVITLEVEKRYIRKDGTVFWAELNTTMILDESGNRQYYFSIIRDITDKVKLRDDQLKLMTLVNNSVDLMSILEMNGSNSYINKTGRDLLGIEANADVAAIPIEQLHTQDQFAFVEKEVIPSIMNDGKWSGKFAARNIQTGELIPLFNNAIRIDDPVTGKPIAIGAVMRDLRPEIAAQQALINSESRFRNMMMQAPVAISIHEGIDMVITSANNAILELWGKDESVLNKPLLDAIPEIKDQQFLGLLQKVYTTGEPYYGYETLARLKRKGVMQNAYFNFVYSPIKETSGKITGVMVVAIEVTQQVIARKKLQESEERFRRLILEAPMATALYVGKDFRIELANDAMIKLWGKDESVIGKQLADALPELEGQQFLGLLKEVYETGKPYHADQEKADLVVNGRLQSFWFNYTYKPLHDEDGNVFAILNMAVDITKQVILQQQKDEFLGIASHELRTPVTSVKAYTQVLEAMFNEKGHEKEANMLSRMDKQIDRLTNLINDLLDVTKIQAGKLQFNEVKFCFNELVKEVCEDLQHTTNKHNIVLELNSDALVYADRERIGQVITNLVSNAIKYSPGAGKIIVSSFGEKDHVKVTVQDFGIGIPQEKLGKVFEQFFRVNTHAYKSFSGLGLGLYIAAEIIKRQHGRIWVDSVEGQGSTFSFTIPVAHN